MPQVILSPKSIRDLERLRTFLQTKSPEAARRAAKAINDALATVAINPLAYEPDPVIPDYRRMNIPFGSRGYTAMYHYKSGGNVTIVSIKHQLEGGYDNDR